MHCFLRFPPCKVLLGARLPKKLDPRTNFTGSQGTNLLALRCIRPNLISFPLETPHQDILCSKPFQNEIKRSAVYPMLASQTMNWNNWSQKVWMISFSSKILSSPVPFLCMTTSDNFGSEKLFYSLLQTDSHRSTTWDQPSSDGRECRS